MAGQTLGAQGMLSNPLIAMLSPDQQQNLLQLQQRQAIGQAMLGQGMQPNDWGGSQVGGVAYHVSPLNGLTKMLQLAVGNKMSMDSMGQQAQLMGQMYGNAFGVPRQGAAQPDATPQPTGPDMGFGPGAGNFVAGIAPSSQPTPAQLGAALTGGQAAPAPRAGALTLPGKTPQESMQIFSIVGPEAYGKMLSSWAAPTDATRMALAAGQDPAQANSDALFRANFVAPVTGTGIFRDPRTMRPLANNPEIPKGGEPVFDAGGNVVGVKGIDGALRLMGAAKAAETAGEGSALPYAGVDREGNPMPVTNRTTAATQGAAPSLPQIFMQQESSGGKTAPDNPFQVQKATFDRFAQPGESWNNVADRNAVAQRMLTKFNQDYGGDLGRIATAYFSGEGNVAPAGSATPYLKNVADSSGKTVASYVNDIARRAGAAQGSQIYAEPPMGAQANATAAANAQQSELSKKWSDLNGQNQQAQNTISYLSNIKDLASKAATGPQSDRITFVNGLLSLAGSEKATDAVTANNLLDKYSNQIVARLGQGGLGTDAARSIVQSAYPNAHMTPAAIHEAVDNLVGATQMTQAKARILAPLANARDATAYNNTELKFDQNADPRIFQYANIQDPVQRQAFAKKLVQQDPKILTKIQNLQAMGALQ